jgi:hypothetical protein
MLIGVGCEKRSAPPTVTPTDPRAVNADEETATETPTAEPNADGEREKKAAVVGQTMQQETADTMTLKVPSDDEPATETPQDTKAAFSPGIAIGETIPPFSMADQTGATRKLADLMGAEDKVLALVFYRSADW